MYRLILLFILMLSQVATAAPKPAVEHSEFGWFFWHMEWLTNSGHPSTASEADWQPIELPIQWDDEELQSIQNNRAWYRLNIPQNIPETFKTGVFIDRSLMNIEVYFNDDYLGSGGSVTVPVVRNWNQPQLFKIPRSSWHENGTNTLFIHLIGTNGYGVLSPPAIGNYALMKQHWFNYKQLIRIELSRLSFVVMLIISSYCWLLWFKTRQPMLIILAIASIFWLIILSYAYFKHFPLEHPAYLRLTHWCIDACPLCIALFARKKYGHGIKRLTLIVVAYLAALAVLLSLTPEHSIVLVANSLHLPTQAVIAYLAVLTAIKFWHNRSPSDLSFCIGLCILVGVLIHDVTLSLSTDWYRWMTDAHLGHLAVPILFILLCYSLSNMYKNHLLASEHLNTALDTRLGQVKIHLKEQLEHSETLAKEQSISRERERIYNDVHDDLGAKLLSLVYASPEPKKNDLARSALQDLRDVVSRTKTNEVSLQALLSDTLAEQQQRCDKLHVHIQTSIRDNSGNTCYSGHKAVLFKRLIRELVGLFIHNAQVTSLQLNIMVGISGVEAAVIGNADETHIDTVSLKARAARINSEIHVLHEDDMQLQVVFWIPHSDSTSPIEGV